VELDDDSVYLVECRWFNDSGEVVHRYYSRLTKDRNYHDKGIGYECRVVED